MTKLFRTTATDKRFYSLVDALEIDLRIRNGELQAQYDKYNKIDNIMTALVAVEDGVDAGCGCFKKYNETTVEMKRMFVKREFRGRGISRKVLSELEKWAMELGYTKAVLETGLTHFEAISLYKSHGYIQIDNYDQYADLADSICFEKTLKAS